jgi:hypothetical protein
MKTIRIADLRLVFGGDLEPGMILAEGIVLDVNHDATTGTTFANLASGHVFWRPDNDPFQVYGRLAPGMVEAVISERASQ